MKILITGVAGFIGSHVSEHLLKDGHSVIGIDNFDPFYDKSIKLKNLEVSKSYLTFSFCEGNITNINDLKFNGEGIDVVIHLAAKAGVLPSLKKPAGYIDTNLQGTQAILEYMRINKIKKMLFASSSSIYGNNQTPFLESDNVDYPISPYAFTKKSGELLLHAYHHLYDIDVMCLRFFTVFGPRQRPDLAIHKFVRLISEEKPITMYGDGTSARDYTYIEDIVNGIMGSLSYLNNNTHIYEVVNIGNNSPVSLKKMIETIYTICGKQSNIKQISMQPGDVNITFSNIDKANKLFGYQPKVSFEEGIRRFVKWYESNYSYALDKT